MHKDSPAEIEPHYWVMAKLCEPKYEEELKFLKAELAFVKQKIAKRGRFSAPAWGFFGHHDWQRYAHSLELYEKHLAEYREEVQAGVLPVKFAVYNAAELPDTGVHIKVKIKDGRIDDDKKAPDRPKRLDDHGKPWKFSVTLPKGFARDDIKITPHAVAARFSGLGPEDGAVLVNQIVHLHCGPDTEVTYQISSHNVPHEIGEVELEEAAEHTGQSPASST